MDTADRPFSSYSEGSLRVQLARPLTALATVLLAAGAGGGGGGGSGVAPSVSDPQGHARTVQRLTSLGKYNVDKTQTTGAGLPACGTTASAYMINCSGYDSENTWLTYFFGSVNAENTGTPTGTLINFDQTPYGGGSNDLDTNGYLYVPNTCAGGTQCRLIVALDGCVQTQANIGTKFITEARLNKYADTNNLLILYPYQVSSSTPSNPNGCWDWWAFEGSNYALNTGPQMAPIQKTVDQVQSGSGAP